MALAAALVVLAGAALAVWAASRPRPSPGLRARDLACDEAISRARDALRPPPRVTVLDRVLREVEEMRRMVHEEAGCVKVLAPEDYWELAEDPRWARHSARYRLPIRFRHRNLYDVADGEFYAGSVGHVHFVVRPAPIRRRES